GADGDGDRHPEDEGEEPPSAKGTQEGRDFRAGLRIVRGVGGDERAAGGVRHGRQHPEGGGGRGGLGLLELLGLHRAGLAVSSWAIFSSRAVLFVAAWVE